MKRRRQPLTRSGFIIPATQQWYHHPAARRQRPDSARLGLGQAGFTIVELMIATMVFSVILIVITVGVVAFTNAYYKGVNASTTQNTTRDAIDTITQAIQFNGGVIASTVDPAAPPDTTQTGAYCIGSSRFDFTIGKQIINAGTDHVFYVSPWRSGDTCSGAGSFGAQSKELLGPHMRLAAFSISPPSGSSGLFTVNLKVAYGDNDLFESSVTGTIPATGPIAADVAAGLNCKLQTGSQFCAISNLTSTVQKRVQ